MDSVNLSEWLGGYHSKTMGLVLAILLTLPAHGMDAENTACAVEISLAAKYEYSNNTLKPSACISGQGGKGEDLNGKGPEFEPALGISF